ncbi:IS630 family transposase [Nocardia gipuzkoensis]|uniref:IS630 family transposase n=1 Tax=Nocardia gipuzkoensis TaxID=2749991 RepID=UPI00237ED3F4|nr:IS630 family transposase [Nocardia gipuzkoensis]MDE1675269.1 IS630 family transposase [Nocardia gipuzkoensis]
MLTGWARRWKSARSRIVLACAEGLSNTDVAARKRVSLPTVGKWRRRFLERRLDGLGDEPRPGGPCTITDEQVEQVIVATLERQPRNATHWSRTTMAAETGLSRSSIGRIWKAFRLQPHRTAEFHISNDPLFVDKVRDVVGLYLDPPEKAIVLCVAEKAQIQALDRSAPVLPMMPGMPERHPRLRPPWHHHLVRCLEHRTGEVIGQIHRRHRAIEFKKFLTRLDKEVPAELDVHLICDNYGTHKAPIIAK